MSLFGSLYIGTSGLQTSQNALNTTAHNLANLGTTGYTRQQVSQGTRDYNRIAYTPYAVANQQYGLGVTYADVKQVRSVFLDRSYRQEAGREAFYEVSKNTMEEVQDLLQEMNGAEFATAMDNLWTSIQELANDPTSATNQAALVSRAGEFVTRAQSVYDGLCGYQSKMNDAVKTIVTDINSIGDQIMALNKEISKIECGGVERANDLRDQRNLLLDRLAEYGEITYNEDPLRIVTVSFEGTQFVMSDHVNHIGLDTNESSMQYYTPYWEFAAKQSTDADGNPYLNISSAYVYDMTETISSDMNTDIGRLRATLLARGDHNGTYHDIADDATNTYYNKNISQSIIMNIEAEFDQMFNSIVTAVNEVLQFAQSNPATKSGEGDQTDYWLFTQKDPTVALRYHTGDPDSYSKTDFTIANTQINPTLEKSPTTFDFTDKTGEKDEAAMTALKSVFTDERYTLNPNVATRNNIVNYYNSLVSQIATSGSVYKSIYESQEATVNSIEDARQQIVGVSSDEELQFMIQFQNAYNASSRYINVVSEMLEHLINTLGS